MVNQESEWERFKQKNSLKKDVVSPENDRHSCKEHLDKDYGPPKEGWDVVDKENYYNEPGFADSKMENYYFQEIVDASEPEPEMQELMDKYGFEENWELSDYAKKCDDYLNGNVKVSPLKNEAEVLELASFYRDQVIAESEDSLPLTTEERARLSEDDLERLNDLFGKMNEFYTKEANLDDGDRDRRDFFTDTKEHKNRLNDRRGMRSDINRLNSFNAMIGQSQREIEDLMAKAKRKNTKSEKDEYRELLREKPEYTVEELKLLEDCYNWITKQSEAKEPTFANKAKEILTEAQVLEGAQEFAEFKKIPRTRFYENDFKGRKQLSTVEMLENGNKLRLIALNNNMPKGSYYYNLDPDNFWRSKNPKMAFAKVNLLFSAERGKRRKKSVRKQVA